MPGREAVGAQHLVELAQLVARVALVASVDHGRFAEDLRPRLAALGDDVVLREARHRRVEATRQVLQIVGLQAAAVARQVGVLPLRSALSTMAAVVGPQKAAFDCASN